MHEGDQPVRFPSQILMCSDVPCCGVLVVANFVSWWWSDVLWCDVMWLVSRWREDGQCGWSRDVMLCDVVSCHVVSCRVTVMWCDAMGWNDMGCYVMGWDVVVWCIELGDGVLWTTGSPCHSKTRETSIPMRGATLGCKTQEDYGQPMSQNYDSVLQRTSTYYNVPLRYYSGTTQYY